MYLIYVYNPYSAKEVESLETVKKLLASSLIEVKVSTLDKAKSLFPIRDTPALIPICDHLQGEQLLEEDTEANKFRLICEALKLLEEEEKIFYQRETNRIDYVVAIKAEEKFGVERGAYQETIDQLLLDSLGGGGGV